MVQQYKIISENTNNSGGITEIETTFISTTAATVTFSGLTISGTFSANGSNLTNVVNSITTGNGLSANTSNGNITLINTSPNTRVAGSVTTTGSTAVTIQTISGITDNATSIIEVYVKAYQASATNWGVWARTLTVTKVGGVVTIREKNADVDKQSSGLNANSLSFTESGGNILIQVTGIAATTINWNSSYEIIL